MAPSVRLRPHAAVCAAGIIYLAGDLWAFDGPVKHWLTGFRPDSSRSIAKAKASGVVARVAFQPITRSQLDRAMRERLWLQGFDEGEVQPGDRSTWRRKALDDLIDGLLLRIEASRRGIEVKATEPEIDRAFQRFAARFEEGELDTALRSEGLGRQVQGAHRGREEEARRLRLGSLRGHP